MSFAAAHAKEDTSSSHDELRFSAPFNRYYRQHSDLVFSASDVEIHTELPLNTMAEDAYRGFTCDPFLFLESPFPAAIDDSDDEVEDHTYYDMDDEIYYFADPHCQTGSYVCIDVEDTWSPGLVADTLQINQHQHQHLSQAQQSPYHNPCLKSMIRKSSYSSNLSLPLSAVSIPTSVEDMSVAEKHKIHRRPLPASFSTIASSSAAPLNSMSSSRSLPNSLHDFRPGPLTTALTFDYPCIGVDSPWKIATKSPLSTLLSTFRNLRRCDSGLGPLL